METQIYIPAPVGAFSPFGLMYTSLLKVGFHKYEIWFGGLKSNTF